MPDNVFSELFEDILEIRVAYIEKIESMSNVREWDLDELVKANQFLDIQNKIKTVVEKNV